jgi:hypothetical protein
LTAPEAPAGAPPIRPFSLLEQAHAVGALVAAERLLFELLGRRATDGGLTAPLSVWASGASLRAAWRAEQLAALLPVSVGLPAAGELTASPPHDLRITLLEGSGETDIAIDCLALYEELAQRYARYLKAASEAADKTYGIVLRRVIADLSDERAGLLGRLESLPTDRPPVEGVPGGST